LLALAFMGKSGTWLQFAGRVRVIPHDRGFLDRIAAHILAGVTSHLAQVLSRLVDWLVVSSEGDSHWTFFDSNYQEYAADKRKQLGEEGAKPKRIRYKPISR
jgi:hypothetical protein